LIRTRSNNARYGVIMEFLLFLILVLTVFLSVRATQSLKVLKRIAGYPARSLKGNFVQIDILISKGHSTSPLYIKREVTQSGLGHCLVFNALACFDSLSSKKYLIGKELEIRCFESINDGDRDGFLGLMVNRQDFALQGHLNCSEKCFSFIVGQLSAGKPLLLRVYGRHSGSVLNGVQAASDKFEILVDGQLSGPDYFCERYEAHWLELDNSGKEKLIAFEEEFRRQCVASSD